MPDYSRFRIYHTRGRFGLLDQDTGWVWKGIRSYSTILTMMSHILQLQFKSDGYKRIRRLDGDEWEAELNSV